MAGTQPTRSRPWIPGYGIPADERDLLPWSHVEKMLTRAMAYWVCTVDPQGRPHATPVDGTWLGGALYFSGAATTRRHRNLLANPAACIHLESASEVIILHGSARALLSPENALVQRLIRLAREKYGYAAPPEAYSSGGVFVFTPQQVFAWSRFPKDATRWTFADGS